MGSLKTQVKGSHPDILPCRRALFVAFVLVVACLPAPSASAPDQYADAIELSHAAVTAFMEVSGATGVSVAVGINGRILWSEGFGYGDLENHVPVTSGTRFRLGSVSKVLTAAAVGRLYQEQKLDLDAPIQRYVPAFPEKGHPITARQLAGHLGGIRHYQEKDYGQNRNIDFEHYETIADSLKVFQDDPLISPPGTRYFYSTFGYTLLSRVVESAAQQSFLEYLDASVFQPLEMRSTFPDYPDRIIPSRTRFYVRSSTGQIINAPYVDSSYKWAGGGLLSTAEDLVRFGTAHLHPGFFKTETLKLFFTSLRTSDGRETGVGVGWRIATDEQGRKIFHHAGSINGGRTVLLIYPDSGLVVVFLSNLTNTPAAIERTAQTLAEPFLDGPEPPAGSIGTIDPAGIYDYAVEAAELSTRGTIEITRAGTNYAGTMTTPRVFLEFARRTGQPAVERLHFVHVTTKAKEAIAIVASPAGIFPLRMRIEGRKISGQIKAPLGPSALEMVLEGTKR